MKFTAVGTGKVPSIRSEAMQESILNIDKEKCTEHSPVKATGRVGETTTCRFCGVPLMFSNHGFSTRNRMSKKERRKLKALTNKIIDLNTKK